MTIDYRCPHCGHQGQAEDQYAGQTGPCAACGQSLTIPAAGASAAYVSPATASEAGSGSKLPLLLGVVALVAVLSLCMVGILIALLLPAVQSAREAARRNTCQSNLKQVGLAMHIYHDAYGSFPPAYTVDDAGRPLHSWRTLLLPFLEQNHLYDQLALDEPWDSPHNRQFHDRLAYVYHCPSSPGELDEPSYMVVVGDETAFPPGGATRGFQDLTDGASNTILIVEVKNAGTHWMEPVDLDFDQLRFRIGQGEIDSHHPGLANVAMADGSIRSLSEGIDPANLRAMLTAAAGDMVTW